MNSNLFSHLTVIIPTIGKIYYDDILYFNIDCLLKLKIKVIIVTNFNLKKIKKNFNLKIIVTNKKKTYEKLHLALCQVKSRDVFFQRDDVLIHTAGFTKIYKVFKKNLKLSACQGIKLIVDKYNTKKFYPHNPYLYDYYDNFLKKKNIFNKIKYCLSYGPECFWTFHRSEIVKKFFKLVKKNFFLDPYILYEYYIIFFLYIYGDIKWIKYPISMQIKFRPDKNQYKTYDEVFSEDSSAHLIEKNLEKIARIFIGIRGDKSKEKVFLIKEIMKEALQIRLKNPKPRDLEYNNFLDFARYFFKKFITKIYSNFFKNSGVPYDNDIYFKSYIKKNNFYYLYFDKDFIRDYRVCTDFINKINLHIHNKIKSNY